MRERAEKDQAHQANAEKERRGLRVTIDMVAMQEFANLNVQMVTGKIGMMKAEIGIA